MMVTSSNAIPQSFGAYLLDEMIAEGGMARVYQARLRGLGGFEKKLVLKIVLSTLSEDPRFISMFVNEAKAVVQLDHPNIVSVFELGVIDKRYFMSMERVEGVTLASLLKQGPLVPEHTIHIASQLCDALDYAHRELQLVHRDVTPRNVMIDRHGNVRLLDFGIATPTDDETEDLYGTPGYIAPELWRREPATPASDVYSVGALLYMCMSGEHALPTDRSEALANADDPAPVSCPDDWPELLRDIIEASLSDASTRPATSEVMTQTRSWLASAYPQGVKLSLSTKVRSAMKSVPESDGGKSKAHTDSLPAHTENVTCLATHKLLQPQRMQTQEAAIEGTQPFTEKISPSPKPSNPPPATRRLSIPLIIALLAIPTIGFVWMNATKHSSATTEPRKVAARPPVHSTPPKAKQTAKSDTKAEIPPQVSTKKSKRHIRLSATATPWAEVKIDGKKVGETPIRRASVSEGTHRVEFFCPPLGKRVSKKITLSANQNNVRLVADMTKDKPTLRVR